jgi:hypothetical protein
MPTAILEGRVLLHSLFPQSLFDIQSVHPSIRPNAQAAPHQPWSAARRHDLLLEAYPADPAVTPPTLAPHASQNLAFGDTAFPQASQNRPLAGASALGSGRVS